MDMINPDSQFCDHPLAIDHAEHHIRAGLAVACLPRLQFEYQVGHFCSPYLSSRPISS